MVRDKYNIIGMFMAALLHALFVVSLLFVFDLTRPTPAAPPLAIQATLVSADELEAAPRPKLPDPEPAPEMIEEPEPEPEPDTSEQERIEAEERARQEELAREKARVQKLEEQERLQKIKDAEDQRKREEAEKRRIEEERKREEEARKQKEAELERQRVEAEKKRQEEIERQRKENERLRQLALEQEAEELRMREIAEEEARLAAMNSGAMSRYQFAIQQKIMRNWAKPASAQAGIECVIDVRQLQGGEVVSATVGRCNGNEAVRRSIEAAVHKASPLPEPENPALFQRDLRITFKPEE